jgi:Ca2+-binding RTX toxin-like protein
MRRVEDTGHGEGGKGNCAPLERSRSPRAAGCLRILSGSATVFDAFGRQPGRAIGDRLYEGDRIATGADGRAVIAFDDGSVLHVAADTTIELAQFDFDSDDVLQSARIEVTQGRFAFVAGETPAPAGFSIDTPFAELRSRARAGAIGTLTAAALMVALLRDLEAAGNNPFLIDDVITYKDLKHGTLLIAPKGGATRGIVLDDPEVTIVVGPPESGFLVQQIANSAADMLRLLSLSDAANLTYLLGLADPLTTGSTDRAETHLFFPNRPEITFASVPLNLLPPLSDDPGNLSTNFTTGGNNSPPSSQLTLVFAIDDAFFLKHNETAGVQVGSNDTAEDFPFDLSGIPLIGRAQAGTPAAPFVDTTGSQLGAGTLTVAVEAASFGVPSGLQVTGGDLIFLFTESIGGHQVVVGREGDNGAPNPTGAIAFVIYVTPDGQTLWAQASLPIDHGDDGNSTDTVLFIDNDALLVRLTLTDGVTTITETAPVGGHVGFQDDGPTLVFAIGDALVLSHDETTGVQDDDADNPPSPGTPSEDDTGADFPISLAGIAGIGGVIGRAEEGAVGAPFVDTSGTTLGTDGLGSLVVTLEASAEGVDSGLQVTGGDKIFLFTETTDDGDQVVVGREGSGGAADATGAVAFVIYVTEDGQTLWLQQSLPVDHGDDGNNFDSVVSIADDALLVRVTVTDGDTDFLSKTQAVGGKVAFEDDGPIALDDFAQVQAQSELATVNALFILDKSGSMGDANNASSRISLAKAAILDFASQDNVQSIRILLFDGEADTPSVWFDLTTPEGFAALEEFLDDVTGGGGTNYQDAIEEAQDTWTAPPNGADLTNVYFISDGAPSAALTDAQIAAWETFLVDNGIDNAYAVGIGTGASDSDLQDVAYPNDADHVVIIDSAGDLSATLQATTTAGSVSGNVIDNLTIDTSDDDSFGADGPGYIKSLRYDSDGSGSLEDTDDLYAFDGTDIYLNGVLVAADAHEITFDTGFGGQFTFDFLTGAWNYDTPTSFADQFIERFAYTIVDADGDESESAALDITVLPPPPTYTLAGAPDVTEGDSLIFTLTLSHASAENIIFRLATADGTATGGLDFETSEFRYSTDNGATWLDAAGAGHDEVTIPAGQTSILIEVDTSDDAFDESNKESMQLVVDDIIFGAVTVLGSDGGETGLIRDNENVQPVIIAPSSVNYWTTSPGQSTNVTFINRVQFQDADAHTGAVVVTLNIANGGGNFEATSGGGVTVGGSGTSTMTLTGTLAAINAFIGGNKIEFDPPGASLADRVITVTIDDNDGGVASTNITLHHQSLGGLNDSASSNVDLAGWNFNDVDVNMGSGNDTVVTSWSHGPSGSEVHYDGGRGGDTITLVFTPQQLEEILTNWLYRGRLDNFLEGETEELDLGGSSWNAEVRDFENANLALAAGPTSHVVYAPANSSTGIPNWPFPSSGADYLQGTGGANATNGLGGNDIVLGLEGNDTLSGGSGSDLILGGAGNDRIDGGEGNDLLSGGQGADTFVAGLNSGLDTIVDYSFVEGDILDLSALLDANFGVVSSDINMFVQLTQTGSDIHVFVDPAGTGTFNGSSQVFLLAGIGTGSGNDPVKVYLENTEYTMTV